MRLGLLIVLLLAAPRITLGASVPDFSSLAYEQKTGSHLPLQQVFRDKADRRMLLSDMFGGKPLILVLGYFHCPNLCSVVRADLFDALRASAMTAGRDYSLVALSIDPSAAAFSWLARGL